MKLEEPVCATALQDAGISRANDDDDDDDDPLTIIDYQREEENEWLSNLLMSAGKRGE